MNGLLTFDFVCLPEPRTVALLLEYSLGVCSHLLLVERHEEDALGEEGHRILAKLAPFLDSEQESNAWPGTVLHGPKAIVRRYRWVTESRDILAEGPLSLEQWRHPDRLEDPCLLRISGEPWLVTISLEEDVYMKLSEQEYADLVASVPHVRRILVQRET